MANAKFVQVLNARNDLVQKASGFLLPDALVRDNILEEFAAPRVLHNQEKFFFALNDLVELDDDGVSDNLEDVDFSADTVHIRRIHNLVLLEYFNGYFLISE